MERNVEKGVYLVIMDGTFGSTYDADGNRTSNPVRDEFWINYLSNINALLIYFFVFR